MPSAFASFFALAVIASSGPSDGQTSTQRPVSGVEVLALPLTPGGSGRRSIAANVAPTAEQPSPSTGEAGEPGEPGEPVEPVESVESGKPVEPGEPVESMEVARENWRLVVAGDVLIGVGMAGFGVMVAGLAVRSRGQRELDRLSLRSDSSEAELKEARQQRELGVNLALAGGVGTAVLVAAGVTMVVVGNKRERRRRNNAVARAWGQGPRPWLAGRRGASRRVGLSWGWRF